ncbi:MAG: molybdenum cofactor biosynthesis protein MoaE [Planctomycetes bacterium]|nr:molybdenum cofactor biosynthesis protein MoaE [Planctomycetota bacterium]
MASPSSPLRIRHARIHDGPLRGDLVSPAALIAPGHGALTSFLGVVRDHSRGRTVTALHYECYRPMAQKVLAALIDESAARFDRDLSASIVHGLGPMVPGDVALAIHVGSAHRAAALDACRHLIERIKQDLPMWKRERSADGTDAWLAGS